MLNEACPAADTAKRLRHHTTGANRSNSTTLMIDNCRRRRLAIAISTGFPRYPYAIYLTHMQIKYALLGNSMQLALMPVVQKTCV
jgi:hypothetical protein